LFHFIWLSEERVFADVFFYLSTSPCVNSEEDVWPGHPIEPVITIRLPLGPGGPEKGRNILEKKSKKEEEEETPEPSASLEPDGLCARRIHQKGP
jgi:hypothetical protein